MQSNSKSNIDYKHINTKQLTIEFRYPLNMKITTSNGKHINANSNQFHS